MDRSLLIEIVREQYAGLQIVVDGKESEGMQVLR